jgi:hypothetical protein
MCSTPRRQDQEPYVDSLACSSVILTILLAAMSVLVLLW